MHNKRIIVLEDREHIDLISMEPYIYQFKDVDNYYYLFTLEGTQWTLENLSLDKIEAQDEIEERDFLTLEDMEEILNDRDIYLYDSLNM